MALNDTNFFAAVESCLKAQPVTGQCDDNEHGPMPDWDTSKITKMVRVFYNKHTFNGDISRWNTASVTDMGYMFAGCLEFNQQIGAWITARVTNMGGMFNVAYIFNQPIGGWNTAEVTDMSRMFRNTRAFNQPIGDWNTANVYSMRQMFQYAKVFNQTLKNWETPRVINMQWMFSEAYAFDQPIGGWNTAKVRDMGEMFSAGGGQLEVSFAHDITGWTTTALSSSLNMFNGNKAWAAKFNRNPSGSTDGPPFMWTVAPPTSPPSPPPPPAPPSPPPSPPPASYVYTKVVEYACSGRNELGNKSGYTVAQAQVHCDNIPTCVSFEDGRAAGYLFYFSTTCAKGGDMSTARASPNWILYIKEGIVPA